MCRQGPCLRVTLPSSHCTTCSAYRALGWSDQGTLLPRPLSDSHPLLNKKPSGPLAPLAKHTIWLPLFFVPWVFCSRCYGALLTSGHIHPKSCCKQLHLSKAFFFFNLWEDQAGQARKCPWQQLLPPSFFPLLFGNSETCFTLHWLPALCKRIELEMAPNGKCLITDPSSTPLQLFPGIVSQIKYYIQVLVSGSASGVIQTKPLLPNLGPYLCHLSPVGWASYSWRLCRTITSCVMPVYIPHTHHHSVKASFL